MIESNFENLIKGYRQVAMTPEEKREVFKQSMLVIEKIEAVSLVHSDKKASKFGSYSSENGSLVEKTENGRFTFGLSFSQNLFTYIKRRQFVPALVASFLLLFTGGASLLAEQALPGDSLYSVKLNVNESIRDLTAVTDEAKAKLAVEITEKRLQEAAVLSAQGNLSEENKQILQDQFIKRAEQIRNRVASLVSKNNLNAAQEVVVDFESALTTHELILESLSLAHNPDGSLAVSDTVSSTATVAMSDNPDGTQLAIAIDAKKFVAKPEVASLLVTLKNELDMTKNSRIDIQEKVMASIAASSSINLAGSAQPAQQVYDSNIKELRFTIIDIQTELKAYEYASTTIELVNKRLDNASSSIIQINNHIKAGQFGDATAQSRSTLRNLAEIQVILKVEKNSKDSLDGKVDIASLLNSGTTGEPVATGNSSSTDPTIGGTDTASSTDASRDTIVQ